MLDIANMVQGDAENPVYRALMAIKPDGLALNAWANRAGIHRSMFNAIRRHGNPTSDTLAKLLSAVGVSQAQFHAVLGGETDGALVRTEVAASGISDKDAVKAWTGDRARPLPLVGSAIGGEWEDIEEAVELTELHLGEVFDYVGRPPSLAGDGDAYAVTIVGDSMAPRFEPGERAYVSPKSPVGIGDDVIVQLKNGEPDDSSDVAGRVTMVLIKRLVRRTATAVELRQFNPDRTFKVPMARVAAIHRVVGRL